MIKIREDQVKRIKGSEKMIRGDQDKRSREGKDQRNREDQRASKIREGRKDGDQKIEIRGSKIRKKKIRGSRSEVVETGESEDQIQRIKRGKSK